MKAAYVEQLGPPENIKVDDQPTPTPTAGQVLVRVNAAALNPIDTYLRGGSIQMTLPRPYIVGCDLAGVVDDVGSDVSRFHPGDRVWGSNQGLLGRQGTFAEYAAVDEQWLYPIPDGVSDEATAACALVGITAHLGLVRDAKLQAGETLFVNGGTGGVGSMVVQMAKAMGARVITTAGSDEKVATCLELGADVALNYNTEYMPNRLKAVAPEGINVWWETLREPDFDLTVPLLADRGRMILMAGRDARPTFPVGQFYVKGCHLYGFAMFNATPEEQRAAADDINNWLAAGTIVPRIDRIMSLEETAAAHRLQEENTVGKAGTLAGKIVIRVADLTTTVSEDAEVAEVTDVTDVAEDTEATADTVADGLEAPTTDD
jgi:NADPH2:quinone reductase